MQLRDEQKLSLARKYLFAFITITLSVFLIYSNSLNVEWHYDDHFNILQNKNIRLTDISLDNLQKTFYTDDRIIRPLAYFSFALNYFFGQYNVFGYHLVNILIHLAAALFLFMLIFQTLNLPTISKNYKDKAYSIALLSAFLWSLHPIQVHAVTTIVQRMASMAGMFYVLSMLLYLHGRLAKDKHSALIFYLSAIFTGILSLGAKENAIMLPISIFLYDFILIQGLGRIKKNLRQILIFCAIIAFLLITVSLFYLDLSAIPESYSGRPYTLTERLLTEPRVIVFYISLLLYPLTSRMTLLHDPAISHSLLDPWTTLPAIILITVSLFIAFRLVSKKPLLSFCIFFFFLNHVVEGTFIALELIYEHRNYIPAMFFFIPVSIGMIYIISYFSYKDSLKYLFTLSFSLLLSMMAHTVYARNQIMNTEINLWLDNVKKSPNLSRVHNNIGQYFWNRGLLEEACTSFSNAYNLNREMNKNQYGLIACNLGNCYFNLTKQFDKAKILYEKALQLYPGDPSSYSGLGLVYLKKGDIAKAKVYMQAAIKAEPDDAEFLRNLALIYFTENDYDRCIALAKKSLSVNSKDIPSLMLLAQTNYIKGNMTEAIKYWTELNNVQPKSILGKTALIEIYTITNNFALQASYLKMLKDIIYSKSIPEIFKAAEDENLIFPIYIPNRQLLEKTMAKEFIN